MNERNKVRSGNNEASGLPLSMSFFDFNFFQFLTIKEGGHPPCIGERIKLQ